MKERFLSYSQELEDLILFNVLKDIKEGFYIDVGANDPWDISVTKALYERGWNGINIEPLSEKFQLLCRDRERDINLQVGVGSRNGSMIFYETIGSDVSSTLNIDIAEKMIRNGSPIKKSEIPVYTLSTICKEQEILKDKDIHFCKVDVEGFEREALLGFDFSVFRPWIFVVESAEPGTTISCHEKWEDILIRNGYEFAFEHLINRFYVDKSKHDLKQRFISMDELNKQYDVFRAINFNPYNSLPYRVGEKILTPLKTIYRMTKRIRSK